MSMASSKASENRDDGTFALTIEVSCPNGNHASDFHFYYTLASFPASWFQWRIRMEGFCVFRRQLHAFSVVSLPFGHARLSRIDEIAHTGLNWVFPERACPVMSITALHAKFLCALKGGMGVVK